MRHIAALISLLIGGVTSVDAQRVVGINCFVNGRYVWYEGRSTCPAAPAAQSRALSSPGGGGYGMSSWEQFGFSLGSAIGSAIMAGPRRDPEAERIEMERRREEARRRAEEEERRREQLHQRLTSALRLSGLADLNVRFDGERRDLQLRLGDNSNELAVRMGEPQLAPRGTSFFGLGGGPRVEIPPELEDTRVVDLRNLRRSVAFLRGAATVKGIEEESLISETLNIANGDTSLSGALPPDDALPVVSENGLLAFQQANIDYAHSRDWLLHRTRLFQEAVERQRIADELAKARRSDVEQALRAAADASTTEQKRVLLARALAALKERDEALERARRLQQQTEARATTAKQAAVTVLRNLATGTEPVGPSASEAAWLAFQARMIQERKEIEVRQARIYEEIKSINVPTPETYIPEQEVLILGFDTDYTDAARVRANQVSPISLQPFSTVVSFGTPSGKGLQQEQARVVGDHITRGQYSLNTPQAEPALAALRGKYPEKAFVHSNAASVAEALLNHDIFKAKELHIMGGDRSLANAPALQGLVESGRVEKVIVWVIDKDPVPLWTTVTEQRGMTSLMQSLASRATQALSGYGEGSPSVDYRVLKSPVDGGLWEHHFVETAYFPAIAKAMKVAWAPNLRAHGK